MIAAPASVRASGISPNSAYPAMAARRGGGPGDPLEGIVPHGFEG